MTFTTLIPTAELELYLRNEGWLVVDCRSDLLDHARGRRDYDASHIAGAVFADLEHDLSGPIVKGVTGRHPLPSPEEAASTFSRLGIDAGTQVVAYDDRGGMSASRLWWLLRWLGHDAVAVLDGGWQAWQAEGKPVRSGIETKPARSFVAHSRPALAIDAATVGRLRTDPSWRVIDSRAADRYRGENETMDPVAGHIPGAVCGPYQENLGTDGRFLPADALRNRFEGLLGRAGAEQAVFYCGSGVSAAHNILAVAHAGLGDARLYPGSWSEWIQDKTRPIATGREPGG